MEHRSHAPLCRTSRGGDGSGGQHHQQQQHQHQHHHQHQQHPSNMTRLPPPTVMVFQAPALAAPIGQVPKDFDSCYSSCDDISHPSLSRESSDPSQIDNDGAGSSQNSINTNSNENKSQPSPEAVDFATKLGYSMNQLVFALNRVGFDAKQDQLLSELVKLGNNGANEHVASREAAANATPINYDPQDQLRSIVIDGSNVAMAHGRKEVFSCAGIRDCVRFFVERGHQDIIVFIPHFRKELPRPDSPITDQHLLFEELKAYIVWTPSRNLNGRRVVCYDDRYILKTAEEKDAVIVSNDEYRDLTKENPSWRKLVEQRQLMFTIVDDKFVPPDDPMGRYGPRLDAFLSKSPVLPGTQVCPYARKCTYGNKCKFYHPERANGTHMSVTEKLMKENQQKKSLSGVQSMQYDMFKNKHSALARTQSLNMVKANSDNLLLHPSHQQHQKHQQHQQQYQQQQQQQHQLIGDQQNLGGPRRQHMQLQQVSSAPWQHLSVSRNSSMPLAPVNRGAHGAQIDGGALNHQMTTVSQTHLYAPSTAVWGHSELSVGPLSTGNQSNERQPPDARARVQYHLSNLFSETVVEAVMSANPDETNAQVLCEKILSMGRGFNYPRQ